MSERETFVCPQGCVIAEACHYGKIIEGIAIEQKSMESAGTPGAIEVTLAFSGSLCELKQQLETRRRSLEAFDAALVSSCGLWRAMSHPEAHED